MVGTGPYGRQSALARVSIVDWHGNTLLDEYVRPDGEVTDYRTHVSGITSERVEQATHTLDTIRPVVRELLQDRVLVGHGLKADLHVLDIHHPWYEIRDTAKYEPFMQTRFDDGILWPRKLKDLCVTRNIDVPNDFQRGSHCSVADAIAALRLYQSVRGKWEKVMAYKKSKTMQIMMQQQQTPPQQQQPQYRQNRNQEDDSSQSSAD